MTKVNWRLVPVKKIFDVTKGDAKNTSKRKESRTSDAVPLVTSSAINNGITMFVQPKPSDTVFHDRLTVNNNGSIGYTFYHLGRFIASSDVSVLRFKDASYSKAIDLSEALYFKASIEKQRSNFSYGYKLNETRLKNLKIMIPMYDNGRLDLDAMSEKTKGLLEHSHVPYQMTTPDLSLGSKDWKQFQVKNIFDDITSGNHVSKKLRHPGDCPFVSSSSLNNGIPEFIDPRGLKNDMHRNAISVSGTGSVDYAFYHKGSFINDRDAHVLFKKNLNEYVALFLCTCIRQQHTQFTYGFGLKQDRLWNLKINLPIDNNGRPDYKFMNDYIKSIQKS